MKYYKLTDQNKKTKNGTLWGEGITHVAAGEGSQICTDDVIHVYDHPLKAAMFNPIHAKIKHPVLWGCRVKSVVVNDQLMAGVKSCTTTKKIPLPDITTNQRVRFAILVALEVYTDTGFIKWAQGWLSRDDRSPASVYTTTANVSYAAITVARASRHAAAADYAVNVVNNADFVPYNAVFAAYYAALAAHYVATNATIPAVYYAATAAARATWAAKFDFIALIKRAIREEPV